ncbi:MAG: hypothetical protein PHY28_07430 [Dehalococcoidales bacterium]|nr:hypothetical protein [Dehalococcoidales bacterium]
MKRNRYIRTVLVIFSLMATMMLFGCTGKSGSTSTPARKYEIVKVVQVESQGIKREIYQLRLELEEGARFTIDLNLVDGDNVDCWYKVEKPATDGSIDFQVKAGASVIYTSGTAGATTIGKTSDRFSFTATQAYGTSYRLIFYNNLPDKKSKETIFMEIIYPAKDSGEDSIFIPLEAN